VFRQKTDHFGLDGEIFEIDERYVELRGQSFGNVLFCHKGIVDQNAAQLQGALGLLLKCERELLSGNEFLLN
jgi:hypothetical protein